LVSIVVFPLGKVANVPATTHIGSPSFGGLHHSVIQAYREESWSLLTILFLACSDHLSFAGTMSPEQQESLTYVLTHYPQARIIVATNNDKEGEKFADRIQTIRPDATCDSPLSVNDWNDVVKSQRKGRGI
jgi:hypothetical protein